MKQIDLFKQKRRLIVVVFIETQNRNRNDQFMRPF